MPVSVPTLVQLLAPLSLVHLLDWSWSVFLSVQGWSVQQLALGWELSRHSTGSTLQPKRRLCKRYWSDR